MRADQSKLIPGQAAGKRNVQVVIERIVFAVCPAIGRQAHRTVSQKLIELCQGIGVATVPKRCPPLLAIWEYIVVRTKKTDGLLQMHIFNALKRKLGRIKIESDLLL